MRITDELAHGRPSSTCAAGWLALVLLLSGGASHAQSVDGATRQLLRQQERERALRERQETATDVRIERATEASGRLPADEAPCFAIRGIRLEGSDAARFRWALKAANPHADPAVGRCLGTTGINAVLKRVQNAVIARGYVTTRVLAAEQDLNSGLLVLTVVPGRIRSIRFAAAVDARATSWRNALPARPGDLLNLRDIEQALENLKRVPTVDADIQISPADGLAEPGESDLVIAWRQSTRARMGVTLEDSGIEATGRMQGATTLSLDNLLTWNDLFYGHFGQDVFEGRRKGARSHTLHYAVPYGYWLVGATASAYTYRQTVAGYSANYVYSGSSHSADVKLSRLLYRNATIKTGAYLRAWERDSNNFIDDTEVLIQRRRQGGWEAGFNYKQFIGASTLDADVSYRRGTGAFRALRAPEEDFREGTARAGIIAAEATLVVPMKWGSQHFRYIGSGRVQWNRSRLVPQDRLAIGGRYTVRGFQGDLQLTGDRGWFIRNDVGWVMGASQELYLGADVGHVNALPSQWQVGQTLAGAVLGVRGGWHGLAWDAFAGTPIRKPRRFQAGRLAAGFSLSWAL